MILHLSLSQGRSLRASRAEGEVVLIFIAPEGQRTLQIHSAPNLSYRPQIDPPDRASPGQFPVQPRRLSVVLLPRESARSCPRTFRQVEYNTVGVAWCLRMIWSRPV